MGKAALRIVEGSPYFCKEVELAPTESARDCHSLHYVMSIPGVIKPELASYLIDRYSKPGEVVLDPFSMGGEVPLQAALTGRIPHANCPNPLSLAIVDAKLNPSDIMEVTLGLQTVNLDRPINLDVYDKIFAPFYDLNTFRELLNLRKALHGQDDKAANFIKLIALSLLHGHSSGYFSVYTFPQISIVPEEQERINAKRRQLPDYRSVSPRVLRKAASILRDGAPSILRKMVRQSKLSISDPRDLGFIGCNEIDFILSKPIVPGMKDTTADNWLRLWFLGLSTKAYARYQQNIVGVNEWLDYMSEFLFEASRVLKSGGRIALDLSEIEIHGREVKLDECLRDVVDASFKKYLQAECSIIEKSKRTQLKNSLKERDQRKIANTSRILVLRRK